MAQVFDFVVVGAGMMGSAAARHLAEQGASVAIVGAREPEDRAVFDGPFASHHDAARITRRLDGDPDWSLLSARSIDRYADLEAASGVRFYRAAGALMAMPPGSFHDRVAAVDAAGGIRAERLAGEALARRFPFFKFSEGMRAFFEADGGYIDPRAHVRAELEAAEASGARLIDGEVTGVDEAAASVAVTCRDGARLEAGKVVVACGGYSMVSGLVQDPPDLTVYARTVALLEVDEGESDRLATMPSLIWFPEGSSRDAYLLPPVRYPDGKTWLKIGGDMEDIPLRSKSEMNDWFRTPGDPEVRDYLVERLIEVMPELRFQSVTSASCMTSYTATGKPLICDHTDRIFLLAGGNGAGAKNADEVGRIAACRALGQSIATFGYQTDFTPRN
ncbi:MAG: FAD-dependent oxidoreductase [Paracoccaceae bacterium]|nr:FAD-dependent oxidoreductase [Paracoccaceae bacterium]